jgi:transcriptional regulator with XRE-family HTH domain
VKMARAALGWTVRLLAERAGVSHDTIVRFEKGESLKASTVLAIQQALQDEGIQFIEGEALGVQITRKGSS